MSPDSRQSWRAETATRQNSQSCLSVKFALETTQRFIIPSPKDKAMPWPKDCGVHMTMVKRIISLWSSSWGSWFLRAHPITLLTKRCFSYSRLKEPHSHTATKDTLITVTVIDDYWKFSICQTQPEVPSTQSYHQPCDKHFLFTLISIFYRLGTGGTKKSIGFSVAISQVKGRVNIGTDTLSCWKYQYFWAFPMYQ